MSSFPRLVALLVGGLMLLGAATVHARNGSVLINQKSIRARMNSLLKGNSLRLNKPLIRPTKGISSTAFRKARQTAQGFNSFNYGAGAKNYILGGKRGQKLVVTTAQAHHYFSRNSGPMTHFVARDGKSGTVVGRGFLNNGKIAWTRSKNERGKSTPSERNALARQAATLK